MYNLMDHPVVLVSGPSHKDPRVRPDYLHLLLQCLSDNMTSLESPKGPYYTVKPSVDMTICSNDMVSYYSIGTVLEIRRKDPIPCIKV